MVGNLFRDWGKTYGFVLVTSTTVSKLHQFLMIRITLLLVGNLFGDWGENGGKSL